MRLAIVFVAALALAGCKPSEIYGPESRKDELLGGAPATLGAFPSGIWEDGLGNAWIVAITDTSLAGSAVSDGLHGLVMTGAIDGDTLAYSIGVPPEAPIAQGTARLIDGEHAWFRTLNADGSLNAHGLFHFDHSAQLPVRQSADLPPAADCANPTLQGD